jgi:hypothetical protein
MFMCVCGYELLFQCVKCCYSMETRKVSEWNVLQLQRWTRHRLSSLGPAKGRSINVLQLQQRRRHGLSPWRNTQGGSVGSSNWSLYIVALREICDICNLRVSKHWRRHLIWDFTLMKKITDVIIICLWSNECVRVKLTWLERVVAFNYLCYSRRYNKQCGDIFNKDNRCWYISYLLNVIETCATCFDHIIMSSSGTYEHNSSK